MKTSMVNDKIILEFKVGKYNKDVVDLLTMIEISNKSKASEKDISKLAYDLKSNWWKKNKKRLLNEVNN